MAKKKKIANKFRARDSLMSRPDHINSKERNTPEERRRVAVDSRERGGVILRGERDVETEMKHLLPNKTVTRVC